MTSDKPSAQSLAAAREWFPYLTGTSMEGVDGSCHARGYFEALSFQTPCTHCYLHNDIALALDAARAEERERCAKEVEAFSQLPFGWKAALAAAIRTIAEPEPSESK